MSMPHINNPFLMKKMLKITNCLASVNVILLEKDGTANHLEVTLVVYIALNVKCLYQTYNNSMWSWVLNAICNNWNDLWANLRQNPGKHLIYKKCFTSEYIFWRHIMKVVWKIHQLWSLEKTFHQTTSRHKRFMRLTPWNSLMTW